MNEQTLTLYCSGCGYKRQAAPPHAAADPGCPACHGQMWQSWSPSAVTVTWPTGLPIAELCSVPGLRLIQGGAA